MRSFICMIVSLCVITATVEAHGKKSKDASFGDTVTTNIKLKGDISGSGTGLTIGAKGITIDLNGHTISSTDGTGIGIDNPDGYDDVEIKNGTIEGFTQGIYSDGGDDLEIEHITVDGAKGPGPTTGAIHVLRSKHIEIEDCTITVKAVWLGAHGIRLDSVEDVEIKDCDIDGGFVGISFFSVTQLDDPTTGEIKDCDIENCFIGVLIANSDDAEVKGCKVKNGDDLAIGLPQGIRVGFADVGVSNVKVKDNECTNAGIGIFVNAFGSEITDIEVKDNKCNDGSRGIIAVQTTDSKFKDNECNDNVFFGMVFNNSDDNEIKHNECNANGLSGMILVLGSDGNTIKDNQFNDNVVYGIALWVGTNIDNDILDNEATGNGEFDCFHNAESSPNFWDDNDCDTSSGDDIE